MSEDKKVTKKKVSKKKKTESFLEKKLESIEKSKLPKAEKERYAAMLMEKEESKEGKVPFEVYARARNLQAGEFAGKRAMARSKGKGNLSLKEWDEFFKKF